MLISFFTKALNSFFYFSRIYLLVIKRHRLTKLTNDEEVIKSQEVLECLLCSYIQFCNVNICFLNAFSLTPWSIWFPEFLYPWFSWESLTFFFSIGHNTKPSLTTVTLTFGPSFFSPNHNPTCLYTSVSTLLSGLHSAGSPWTPTNLFFTKSLFNAIRNIFIYLIFCNLVPPIFLVVWPRSHQVT